MKIAFSIVLTATMLAGFVLSQNLSASFNGPKLIERVKRLSADDFEGRGPGTDGGRRAAQYIADELKAIGVKPGNGNSYFQNVPMVGVKADPNTSLDLMRPSRTTYFKFGDDFVATTSAQMPDVSVNGELVFVGYGIDAPNYKWNDYSGSADAYRGKVLMILVNDPPASADEPNLFGGKALTYYGRWTYKFEEAARRGAAGVILVHTTESAGYGWNVVRSSNGSWRYEIARTPDDTTPFLKMKSWATYETASKMLAAADLKLDELTAAAQKRGFKPVETGLRVRLNLKSEIKRFDSPNVVGIVDGGDKKLKDQYVIYSAHWDHLGIGEPDARGDKIFNGAYDNASGVASVLGIAEVLAKLPKKERPERSSLFLFTTAEEQGLLGAEYYTQHPLVPLARTAGNVNIDGVNFFGKVSDFSALGAERSSIDSIVADVARERSLVLEGDTKPEQGFFFRSDHFPFAKAGVPSVSLRHGDDFVTPLKGEALSFFSDYTAKYYHQASDEYKDWWDPAAMIQNAELGLAIGIKLGNVSSLPRYRNSDEFAAADKMRIK